MGRKGECGGTAGGGRSGGKGNVTYSRVIPKFLQKLADPDSVRNPLDAKRPWATGHMKERKPCDRETGKRSMRPRDADPKDEVEKLEAQGFNVITKGEADTQGMGEHQNEVDPNFRERKPFWRNEDRLQVAGGIEKKSRRTQTSTVGKAFDMKNKHKLSFVESDSEDE